MTNTNPTPEQFDRIERIIRLANAIEPQFRPFFSDDDALENACMMHAERMIDDLDAR